MFIYLDLHSFSSAYIYPIVYVVSCVVRNQFATAEEFPINERFPFLFTFLCSLAETTCGFILLFKKCYKKYNKEKEMVIMGYKDIFIEGYKIPKKLPKEEVYD